MPSDEELTPAVPEPSKEDTDPIARAFDEAAKWGSPIGPVDDSSLLPPLPSTPDDSIPGYFIVREIHRGGQGVVYQAIQKTTRREVAVKVMREGPFASKHDKARFEREVQVLAALKHPNIVAIHESGTAAGSFYFVMDYISGQPLDAWMAAGQRSVRETLALFQKICEAVNAAHLRGVIHRDLKPGNIRIDSQGEPQILDFGLAKVAPGQISDQNASMTQTGQFVGSLPWASPEQAEGIPSKIDIRTDVYSLGVMLYQMLTGRFPYNVVGSFREVLDRIMQAEPVRPRALRKDINDEVETIVLKALAKERERRYQSAGELARDIGHYLAGEAIEAKRDRSWYLLKKNIHRYKAPVAVAAGFVLLLTIALVVSLTLWQRSVRQRVEAEGQRLLAQHRLFDGLIEAADSRVKSKQYAEARQGYCEAWDLARQIGLPDLQPRLGWLNSYMASTPTLLVHDFKEEGVARPPRSAILCMTKNGPLVLVQRANVVYLVNPLTGRQVASLTGHTGQVSGFDVSGDGKWFCTGGEDRTVRLWDAASQTERRQVTTDASVVDCFFSPDGQTGFWSEYDGKAARWDLATGEVLWTLRTGIQEFHLVVSPDKRWLAAGGNAPYDILINTDAGQVVHQLDAFGDVAFSGDGAYIVGGRLDRTLRVWEVATGRQIQTISGRNSFLTSLAVSPDGRSVLIGEDDARVSLWDLVSGSEMRNWSGHSAAVLGIGFMHEGTSAISCSPRECLLWNLPSAGGARAFCGHQQIVYAVAISPDGHTALSGDASGLIWQWDVATGRAIKVLVGHTAAVRHLAILPDGRRALSAGSDETLRLWDVFTNAAPRVLIGQKGEPSSLTVSPDGATALSSSYDGSLWLWDLQAGNGRELRREKPGLDQIGRVCVAPDGRSALCGHRGGAVSLLDLASGTERWRSAGHQENVNGVGFLCDGHTGLSVSIENTLILWELATGKQLSQLHGPQLSYFSRVALAPDGESVFYGGYDGGIRMVSTRTGKQLRILSRHAGGINSLAVSRDGRVLLAGSEDRTVSIWDFDLPQRFRVFEPRAAAARERLVLQPQDAGALLILGEWFAFREGDYLAADHLERARKAGAAVSPLLLGRCYWRLGRLNEAKQEFQQALQAHEAPADYLQQCLQAVSRPSPPGAMPTSVKQTS
ncbi:MAG: protein kinase [Phycisphaerae bacterium]|nr:protein kinase [Phycisphaerae bacterium]